MTYLAKDGTAFDNAEDCLRHEGALDANKGNGCLLSFLAGLVVFAGWVLAQALFG